MITAFDIYLIGIADSVNNMFTVLFIFSLIFLMISSVVWIVFCDNVYHKEAKEISKIFVDKSFVCLLIFGLLCAILPSSKTLAAMYVVPSVLKSVQDNKQIQQIPQAVLNLIQSYEKDNGQKDEREAGGNS